jgi:predicted RNase H-like HicB family nuclease
MPRYHFSAIIDHDTDGYWAHCPELPGCWVQGENHEEALANLREACLLHVHDRLASGEDVPRLDSPGVIAVDMDEAEARGHDPRGDE